MTRPGFLKLRKRLFPKVSLILSFLIYSSALTAQTQINFSGIWTKDNAKSDDFYKEFDMKYDIKQTPEAFIIKQTFFEKTGKEITSNESSFKLDGTETRKEVQGGTNKDSAKWSSDKKTLTTTSTRTVGKDVYGSSASYSLSENGLVLTVRTSDIKPGGLSVMMVCNKK